MHTRKQSTQAKTGVSAIIPAYNEQDTILTVIRAFERHPLIDEVIVVSDGSTDETVKRARRSSATVIALKENVGKGDAMTIGVNTARHDVIVFADGDLQGLTEDIITRLVQQVTSGEYDMFTLVRDRLSEQFQLHLPAQYVVGGERALHRELWDMVPVKDRKGFGIELALNYYAQKSGLKTGYELATGLKQVIKEKKRGLIVGFALRIWMTAQCLYALCKLHILGWESKPAYS